MSLLITVSHVSPYTVKSMADGHFLTLLLRNPWTDSAEIWT